MQAPFQPVIPNAAHTHHHVGAGASIIPPPKNSTKVCARPPLPPTWGAIRATGSASAPYYNITVDLRRASDDGGCELWVCCWVRLGTKKCILATAFPSCRGQPCYSPATVVTLSARCCQSVLQPRESRTVADCEKRAQTAVHSSTASLVAPVCATLCMGPCLGAMLFLSQTCSQSSLHVSLFADVASSMCCVCPCLSASTSIQMNLRYAGVPHLARRTGLFFKQK